MHDVPLYRLYLLRAVYLLISVGLLFVVWPGVLRHDRPWDLMEGVVQCMLAAFSLLTLLGLRYPLQMLPVLLWELLWKTLWLAVVAYPQWAAGRIDEATLANAFACMVAIVIPLAMPWGYVWRHYVLRGGDRWRNGAARPHEAVSQ